MANKHQTRIEKDLLNKKISITRSFDADPEEVWSAWTESSLLDQWWAPKPYKAETKRMDFREGGHWLYAMVGPDQTKQWARMDYTFIQKPVRFNSVGSFCDEEGIKNKMIPDTHWKNEFKKSKEGTEVLVELSFSNETELRTIVELGFETGFTAALGNLDQYLQARFQLRKELKKNTMARVTTYLNFPGTTEEAFLFYKSVFGTEFSGKGIQRFGDIPAQDGHPPMDESVKKMVLHIELPTLGGHILMATDAPKEMGFTLTQGNNMHICLEPSTKAETKKLFDSLSDGGTIVMPLEDMFFGSYFGECTDRFGINWMFNCTEVKEA